MSRRKDRAAKRGGGYQIVSLDVEAAEHRYLLEPAANLDAEKMFDAQWASTLLSRVTSRLRDKHVEAGKEQIFDRLKVFLVKTGHEDSNSYRQLAQDLGSSVGAVKLLIFRLRRLYFVASGGGRATPR